MEKTFEIYDGGDFDTIEDWIMDGARELWTNPDHTFKVTVKLEIEE